MKRLVLVFVALILPFILGACQEKLEWEFNVDIVAGNTEATEYENTVEYDEILALSGNLSPHPQGGDCWGDYFFQFTNDNSAVRIYDLATKTLVQTLSIPGSQRGFVSNCHCNSVCFGTEYYDAEDIFPLIYVSTGYAAGGYTGALVYRIVQHNGVFFITLVQTLKFPVNDSSWTEFVPGNDFAYLCYTTKRVVYKVKMPKLKDGNIVIGPEDAIETYQFTNQPDWMASSRNQDRMFYQGKIYVASGVPQTNEASVLFILNLETLERERIIDLKKSGLTRESESIFVWRGDICVAFVDKIVRLYL